MAKVKKELTSEQRVRIKALFNAGWSYQLTLVNPNPDVRCILTAKKLSERQLKHLKILSLKDQRKTSQELCDEINITMTNVATVSSELFVRNWDKEDLLA